MRRLNQYGLALWIAICAITLAGCATSTTPVATSDGEEAAAATVDADADGETAATDAAVLSDGDVMEDGEVMGAESGGEAAEAAAEGSKRGQLEPPEWSEWQVDETGRRYFLDRTPKAEGTYERLPNDVVRVRNLMPIKVEREDDEYFYFRVLDFSGEAAPLSNPGPSDEDVAALEASFEAPELPEVDRLRAVPFDEGLPKVGQWRNGFDLADMNGDGHLDIVHGRARKGNPIPHVFLGDGAGHWQEWDVSYPPLPYDYGDAAAADFNGDGRMDIAVGMHLTGIAILERDGESSFRRAEGPPLRGEQGDDERVFTSRTLEAADWDGDGRPDLLALAEGPIRVEHLSKDNPPLANVDSSGVLVLLNRGDRWEARRPTSRDEGFGDDLEIADFDGDGHMDFAISSSLVGYNQILRLGTEGGDWTPTAVPEVRPRAVLWAVASHDFDADGRADLAVSYFTNRWGIVYEGIDVLYNMGSAEWRREPLVSYAVKNIGDGTYPRYTALAGGDLDGDERADLVALAADGSATLFLADADGGFSVEASPELAPQGTARKGCTGYRVQLADLDGDGGDEIVAGFAGEPGSEQYGLARERYCESLGELTAWKLSPVSETDGNRD